MADTGTVAQFITKNRRFVKDLPTLTRDKFDGDGTTVAFRTNNRPILEDSYTVKVGGTAKTETTHYTIDLDTGLIEFTSGNEPAPGDGNVTIDYKYVKMRDAEWLDIIQNTMDYVREKIWEEKIDETTLDTVANQDDYDLDNISTDIISIVEVTVKRSSDINWTSVDALGVNAFYHKENNNLNFRPAFSTGQTYDMRVRYLEAYAQITATTDTFEPDVKFQNILKYFNAAEYLDRVVVERAQTITAVTKDDSFESLRDLSSLSTTYFRKAEQLLRRGKPVKPASKITIIKNL